MVYWVFLYGSPCISHERISDMSKNLLILLPGIRYGVDCPLLYYTRLAYTYAGYECIAIDDYGVESDDLDEYADLAVEKLLPRLNKISGDEYEHIVFAEKSVGTVIGMKLEDACSFTAYHIVYTPIDSIYSYISSDRRILGMAAGTNDKHIDIKALTAACKKLDIPLVTIKNGGHRLESGKDVTKDISALAQVIASIADPTAVDKLEKKIKAAEKAKLEAAEKKAREQAEKEKREAAEKAAREQVGKKAKEPSKVTIKKSNIIRFKPETPIPDNKQAEMMEIWLQSNVSEQSFIPKKYWSKNYKEVTRVIGIASVYTYEDNGHILGFIASMEEAMVAICVAEGYRSLGIGKLLLDRLKDEMGILEVSVYTKNKRAMEFFNKNEFTPKDIQVEASTGEEIVLLSW